MQAIRDIQIGFLLLVGLFLCTLGSSGQEHDRMVGVNVGISNYGLTKDQLSESSVEEMGRKLINDYSDQLAISSKNITKKKIYSNNGWWMAQFEQAINGIPVERSEVGFTIGGSGRVISLGARIFQNVNCSFAQSIDTAGAIAAVEKDLGKGKYKVFSSPRLVILPTKVDTGYKYNLVWRLEVSPPSYFIYYVGAADARIIEKQEVSAN